jgi:hypothetical protein
LEPNYFFGAGFFFAAFFFLAAMFLHPLSVWDARRFLALAHVPATLRKGSMFRRQWS